MRVASKNKRAKSLDRMKGFDTPAPPMGNGQVFGAYIHSLDRKERELIEGIYERGESIGSVAKRLRMEPRDARRLHTQTLTKIREELARYDN